MACGVVRQHHCSYLFFTPASYCFPSTICPRISLLSNSSLTRYGNVNLSAGFRAVLRPSANNKRLSTMYGKPESGAGNDQVDVSELDTDPSPNSLSVLQRFGEQFKLGGLGMEILSIAFPAALALAADPITSLVDTGFVGHLGPAELAAVGVSGAVFNLVSKLFNVPLLNITTSFVAEEQASLIKDADEYSHVAKDRESKIFLPSVSNAIIFAAVLGIIEAIALSTGSGFLMNMMGFTNSCASRTISYTEGLWGPANRGVTCCSGNI